MTGLGGRVKSYLMGVLVGGFVFSTCYYSVFVGHSEDSEPANELSQNAQLRFATDETNLQTDASRTEQSQSTTIGLLNSMKCPHSKGTLQRRRDLKRLDCRRRLPHVIGIGVEKCGTGALSFFLASHPAIAHSVPQEIYYWNRHKDEDLEWYRNQMPVSSKYQVTVEKTPSYIFSKDIPVRIKEAMPQTKFILIIRDPVVRAVSDYLHLHKVGWPEFFKPRNVAPGGEPLCYLNTTFEGSVITSSGEVNDMNSIIAHSAYVTYLRKWLDLFPRKQFLIIDGDEFVADPLPVLQKVETFLELPKFFDSSSVYFDKRKGFFCKSIPQKECAGESKGTPHPDVRDDVINKLRLYFHPFNLELAKIAGRNFSWT